jgi:signal transduction histidine kinase
MPFRTNKRIVCTHPLWPRIAITVATLFCLLAMVVRASAQLNATPSTNLLAAPLRTAIEVRRLPRAQASNSIPVQVEGVVTCVLPALNAFVIQDATSGLYVADRSRTNPPPAIGELVQVVGHSEPGQAVLTTLHRLGESELPAPLHPTWDQLMNGSMDCLWVELEGINESLLHRSNGWSRVSLRTKDGGVQVELRRAGVTPLALNETQNELIRLRGCVFASWDVATHRVKAGQLRMADATIARAQTNPEDLFSLPRKTAAALLRYDPDLTTFQRIKVAGQIVFVRGYDYFVMDGSDGMRLQAERSLGFEPGDRIEAVGFPEWGYSSPCLRNVIARKTGHAPLPAPLKLSSDELVRARHDAKLVEVEGVLNSSRKTQSEQVFEIQSGSWRFLARIRPPHDALQSLQLGSRLRLTGVYCAQGGYKGLGEDVAPIDLLLNSPTDIVVLTTPSWWTLQRLLIVAGILTFLLVAALVWVTQLRCKVEIRTVELQTQIQNRERAEHQRALEQERARIAHDLHDELGADLTEIGMLATRVRSASHTDTERGTCLEQLSTKTGQMVAALEEIVWAMNPQHDSAAAVVSYFSFYADRFLGLANIRVQMEIAGTTEVIVDARVRHQLFLVFKEALANVVNHAGATEVRLQLRVTPEQFSLTIADNGRGLPRTDTVAGQDGLPNMRTRVENLRGQFALTSEAGRGTTLKFQVPLS